MASSKGSKQRVTAKEREIRALELRKSGATYRAIGESLGITEQGAHKCVMRAIDKLNEKIIEDAVQVRRLELERLDRLFLAIYRTAIQGNLDAIDRILRIMTRRAKLLGLDAVEQAEVSWREEIIVLLKTGRVTPEIVLSELGRDLASELFITAGIQVTAK